MKLTENQIRRIVRRVVSEQLRLLSDLSKFNLAPVDYIFTDDEKQNIWSQDFIKIATEYFGGDPTYFVQQEDDEEYDGMESLERQGISFKPIRTMKRITSDGPDLMSIGTIGGRRAICADMGSVCFIE